MASSNRKFRKPTMEACSAQAPKPEPQPMLASDAFGSLVMLAEYERKNADKLTAEMVVEVQKHAAQAIRWGTEKLVKAQVMAAHWGELVKLMEAKLAEGARLVDLFEKWEQKAKAEVARFADQAMSWADSSMSPIGTTCERLEAVTRAEFYGVKSWGGNSPAHTIRAALKAHEAGLLVDDVTTPKPDAAAEALAAYAAGV